MASPSSGDLPAAKRQRAKGKAIAEESEPSADDSGPDQTAEMICGICLSDAVRSIRGVIDSCDHHFCFVCIMEWAKVETRCPLCKQRFRTIRRPPLAGVFPSERVVDVPERNQVYNPLGNGSVTLSDPYANVTCSVCKTMSNEELFYYSVIYVTRHLILTVLALGQWFQKVTGTAMIVQRSKMNI